MREDLIVSAISFLQDPSIASSPLEKRVAFLRSKNLTQEEIDAALRRVGEAPPASSAAVTTISPAPSPYAPPQPPAYPASYYASQQHRPEVPARDWRDWFIMATVSGGVGYGLYYLTKRYVYPLIAPPTPPQLEADKASIDDKFAQAFDILDTLKDDTAALKNAEEERKARVDAALAEVESVVQDLKNAGKRREDESKRVGDEVRGLRDLIPKALEGQKESQKKALEDLQTELKSLKQLVMNRTAAARPSYVPSGNIGTPPLDPGAAAAAAAAAASPSAGAASPTPMLGSGGGNMFGGGLSAKDLPPHFPRGTGAGGKPSIPSWQLASRANSAPPPPIVSAGAAGGANNIASGSSSSSLKMENLEAAAS